MSSAFVSARATARIRARSRTGIYIGVAIALVACVQAALATALRSPWIVPDELIYSEFAKSIAAGHLPAIRGVTNLSYGFVYPALISPAWLFASTTTAYVAAHVISAFVMPLAAIPAYLLARRFVSDRSATIVAVVSIVLPAMIYTSSLLVENALYPASLFALVAMVRSYERPTFARQVLALVAIGVAFEIKALAIVLVPAHLCSIWLTQPGSTRRRFWPSAVLVLAGAAVAAALATVSSGSPTHVVGAYAVVLSHVDLLAVPWWFTLHLAELAVAVAWLPFVATALLLAGARGSDDARRRLFRQVAAPLTIWTLLAVAAFASWPSAGAAGVPATTARVYERSTFVLLPLFLIGLAMWFESPQRPLGRRGVLVAGAAASLPLLLPTGELRFNADFQAPALVPWLSLGVVGSWWIVFALAIGAASLFVLLRPTPRTPRLGWIAVGAWLALTSMFVYGSTLNESRATMAVGAGAQRDWIDAAVGRATRVAVLWREPGTSVNPPAGRQRRVWINEFFNRSVGTVYVLGGQMPYGLPTERVVLEGRSLTTPAGETVRAPYVLASCDLGVAAPVVASDARTRMAVYRTDGVVRLSAARVPSCV